jgi:hypothetical protein
MRGEWAGPIVIVQAVEKGVLHAVPAKVAVPAKFHHGKSSQASFDQPGKHHFPIVQRQRIQSFG